jgi:hypothetical protein
MRIGRGTAADQAWLLGDEAQVFVSRHSCGLPTSILAQTVVLPSSADSGLAHGLSGESDPFNAEPAPVEQHVTSKEGVLSTPILDEIVRHLQAGKDV